MTDTTPIPTDPNAKPAEPLRLVMWLVVVGVFGFALINFGVGVFDESGRDTTRRAITYHRNGDQLYLWATGARDFDDPSSEWFDLTGSPLPIENFQYGIGKDEIPSIDDPVFVRPDDERFVSFWTNEGVDDIGELQVIGYEHGGVARAYPRALLDRHELVNDTVGGKPVTVGW